jgi:hypothetical protein
MKQIIRRWLDLDGPTPVEARDLLHGAELSLIAYRIDNGYLLRMNAGLTLSNTFIYCTDERDMADKIVAHRAKHRLGVQNHPKNPTYITSKI